jgi:hypothetical protein
MTTPPTNRSHALAKAAARPRLQSAPVVVIRIEFERSEPLILADYDVDSEGARMSDWLTSHPELHDIVVRAVELQRREQAA